LKLTLDDPEILRLAQAISQETGETLAAAITKALRERYARLQDTPRGKASVDELRAIADRAAAYIKRPYVDHAELLFDEHGLPK
jgi:antitoxin VapB